MSDSPEHARGTQKKGSASGLGEESRRVLTKKLNAIIADLYALELRTLSCRGFALGLHSPGVRRVLEHQASAMHASHTKLMDRVCSMGGNVPATLDALARNQRLPNDDMDTLENFDLLTKLLENTQQLTEYVREAHALFELDGDVTGAGLIADVLGKAEEWSIQLFQIVGPS
jgi:DNA-binding ferritin-like protein